MSDHSVPRPPCTTIALPHSQSLIGTHSHSPPTVRLLTHSLTHSLTVTHCRSLSLTVFTVSQSVRHTPTPSVRGSRSRSHSHTHSHCLRFVRSFVCAFVRSFVCSFARCRCVVVSFSFSIVLWLCVLPFGKPFLALRTDGGDGSTLRRLGWTECLRRVSSERSFQVSSMKCRLLTRKNAAEE